MNDARHIRFRLDISADDYLAYYRGSIRDIVVGTEDGRRVKFPAGALQPFVTRTGIRGRFELRFDANNKLIGLHRLGD